MSVDIIREVTDQYIFIFPPRLLYVVSTTIIIRSSNQHSRERAGSTRTEGRVATAIERATLATALTVSGKDRIHKIIKFLFKNFFWSFSICLPVVQDNKTPRLSYNASKFITMEVIQFEGILATEYNLSRDWSYRHGYWPQAKKRSHNISWGRPHSDGLVREPVSMSGSEFETNILRSFGK